MKLNPYFSIQQIGGSSVLLPSGKTGWRNHGVIQLTDDEVMIVRYLTKDITEDELIHKLELEEKKPQNEWKTIVKNITNKLRECGAITD